MNSAGPTRYRARVKSFEPNASYQGPNKQPKVVLRPRLATYCNAVAAEGFAAPTSASCGYGTAPSIEVSTSGSGWSAWQQLPMSFAWSAAAGSPFDLAYFNLDLGYFDARIEGTDTGFKRPGGQTVQTAVSGLGTLPTLRCDKGVAQKGTAGCVFPQAAAVYVLKTSDFEVKEAAEHVAEAQAGGSPGAFAMREGTRAFADSGSLGRALQRLKNPKEISDPNRRVACGAAQASLINSRPPKSSNTCSPNQANCQCDEYPFNATYQGAFYAPETTSVKWINGSQNLKAGGGKLSNFYRDQRLLDFGEYLSSGEPPLSSGLSDLFWVATP